MEEWRTVPLIGAEDYEISSNGNIRLLPRDVPTRIVNRGRDMIVTAHRKGKDIKPSYEGGRPIVRLRLRDGSRKKLSLPLLVLKTFKMDECPGDIEKYTAAYIDGDNKNNKVDNLVWISKSALMSSISSTIKGEPHDYLKKYDYYIIKVNNQIVGYFNGTKEAEELFNGYGFNTSSSAISRVLSDGKQFFFMFDFEPVSETEYLQISMIHPQVNLKMIYDIVMEDRRHCRKSYNQNTGREKIKTVVKKEVVYRDRVIKQKPEKEIVEKIVYVDRKTGEKVRKPRDVNKSVHNNKTVEKMVENVEKQNDTKSTKHIVSKSMFSNPNWDKNYDDDFVNIDTLDFREPTPEDISNVERDIEMEKRNRFKEELLKRMNNS